MAKYPLTDRQKNMIRALLPGLRDGTIKTTWTMMHGDDRITAIGGFRNPEIRKVWDDVEDADFVDFVNSKLFNGYPNPKESQYTLTLSESSIADAVDHDFADDEPTPSAQVNFYGGDFRGAIVNAASKLTDVQQSIGADTPLSEKLTDLIEQLKEALANAKLDDEDAAEAEVLAHHVQVAVDQLNSGKPNKKLLSISVDGLEQAAKNIERIAPRVVKIAAAIALILRPFTM